MEVNLSKIIDKNPSPLLVFNAKGKVIYQNKAVKKHKLLKKKSQILRKKPKFLDIGEKEFLLVYKKMKGNLVIDFTDVTKEKKAQEKLEQYEKSLEIERDFLLSSKKQVEKILKELRMESDLLIFGVEEIGKGNFQYKFDLKKFKKLLSVANTFNRMISEIGELVQISQEKTQELLKREEIAKEYTANLKSSLDQLKEMDKMKNNFLSITSHELKTPLTPVTAQLELLLGRMYGNLNEKQTDSLKMILRNIKRLSTIISNVALSSKMIRGKVSLNLEMYDINTIIRSIIEDLYVQIHSKNIKLELDIEKAIPKVLIDRDRFVQIMTNLIINAVKFNKQNGKIWVIVKTEKKHLKISIKDTGIGIPKSKQAKLFTPFYQVEMSRKRKYGGTGLGLSICKNLVEMMGGNIYVQSSGKGSTFSFTIPIQFVREKPKEEIGVPDVLTEKYGFPELKIETSPEVKKMIRKGILTKEGEIVEGLRFKDLKGKIPLDYNKVIQTLIIRVRELIKESAIRKANEVAGLEVNYTEIPSVRIKGSPDKVLEELTGTYRELLGYLIDSIEEEIVRDLIKKKLLGGGEEGII